MYVQTFYTSVKHLALCSLASHVVSVVQRINTQTEVTLLWGHNEESLIQVTGVLRL